jgi:predicted HD phosphohydrolase
VSNLWHLAKRFITSLTAVPLTATHVQEIDAMLLPAEMQLFSRFSTADQRHALVVLRRFDAIATGAPTAARRAALLHDIGKIEAPLGTLARVLATLLGGRTARFRAHHEHEARGAKLLHSAGSDALTVALVAGAGEEPWKSLLAKADAV